MLTTQCRFCLPLIFRISAFRNELKISLSVKYGFVLSIFIAYIGGLPGYSGIDQLEMPVLFQDTIILMSLASDWSMFDMIFSYDVKQNFKNLSKVFLLNMCDSELQKQLTLVLMFFNKYATGVCSSSKLYKT